jgi:protein-S-isoprenylcysteine O-methyltransferase Ste14
VRLIELKIPPLVLTLLVAGAMWLATGYGPALGLPMPWRLAIALVFCLAGSGIAGAGVLVFRKARTTVDPTRPHRAEMMVVSGPYRLTRNPMYLGFALVLAGWAIFLNDVLSFLLLPAFVLYLNRFQIQPEERALSARFGIEYARYMKSVRRWF